MATRQLVNRALTRQCLALLCSALLSVYCGATSIVLVNGDGPGEGFNDLTPVSPVGGNSGTTLGEQRQIAFEHAAGLLAEVVNSSVTIAVAAQFSPLTCTTTSATLASAGPSTVHSSFINGVYPARNTYYVQALANAIRGFDQNGSLSDINMTFNSNVNGNAACLNGKNWYYGLDGNPGTSFDYVSTTMHELLHGLGFTSLVNSATGVRFNDRDDAYMLNLEDNNLNGGTHWDDMDNAQRAASATDDPHLVWTGANVQLNIGGLTAGTNGGRVRMHAPSILNSGSSVSHFSSGVEPYELMEPMITGAVNTIGLARYVLQDIGWPLFSFAAPVLAQPGDLTIVNAAPTPVTIAFIDNDSLASAVTTTATSSNQALLPDANLVFSGTGRGRALTITPSAGVSGLATVTVTADDGTSSRSVNFDVTLELNNPPALSINAPADGSLFLAGPIDIAGSAIDVEDGDLSASINWQSTIDGSLGSGAMISPALTDGSHTIVANVVDSDVNLAVDSISINVDFGGDLDSDGLSNALEIALGTDPNDADSDDDGVSDFDELNRDGDPSNYTVGTDSDPNNEDTDGDTLPDGIDDLPLFATPAGATIPLLPAWALALLGLLTVTIAARQRRS